MQPEPDAVLVALSENQQNVKMTTQGATSNRWQPPPPLAAALRKKRSSSEPAVPFFQPSIVDEHGKLDHSRAPLIEGIAAYRKQNMTPFATPGHKLGKGMDPELVALYGADAFACDIPVSGGADAIHFNLDTWRLAEELGADAWNSDRTFYLVNGSSTGNLAFLTAQLRPGDKVIVARDVHKSMMVALIQSGARPVYIAPRLHPKLDIGLGNRSARRRGDAAQASRRKDGDSGQPVVSAGFRPI